MLMASGMTLRGHLVYCCWARGEADHHILSVDEQNCSCVATKKAGSNRGLEQDSSWEHPPSDQPHQ